MAGLLDIPGFDPAEFQVSDEERKKLLIGNILLGISAGAFNSNKGNQIGALGSGMLLGVQNGQRALSDAQQSKLDKLKAASGFMDFAGKKQAYQDDQAARAAEQAYQPSGLPTTGDLSPRPENLARLQQKQTLYEQLMAKADYFDAQKLPRKAKEYRDEALKLAPKYKGMETVIDPNTNQPILLQTYENQAPTPSQYQPKPDITMQDFGGSIGAIDRLRVQNGQTFAKSMTPGEVASNELGRMNYGLSAAHLKLAQDRANQDKGEQFGTPIQITTPEGGTSLMIPKKGTNELVPMVDPSGNAVTKSASIPQKYKDTSYSLANLKGAVDDYHNALAEMKPADFFKPAKLAEIEAKFGATQMGLKNLFELGAIAGPDMQIISQNLTNPTTLKGMGMKATGGLEAQNKVIKTMLDRAEANLSASYNQPQHADVKSSSAYDALPRGAIYTAPDGTKRRKQ